MKKARIMLTSIAVLAVVGGALAFKVKADANVFCKIHKGTPQEICQKQLYRTDNYLPFPQVPATTIDPCPEETVFYTAAGCAAAVSSIETLNTVYTTNVD